MESKFIGLLLVLVMVNGEEDCSETISNCPFYNFQTDKVTLQQLQSQDVVDETWLMIYYTQFEPNQPYTKCMFRWSQPDQDGVIRKNLVCYDKDTQSCLVINHNVKRKTNSCGRAAENEENIDFEGTFYSQDPSQYLWYYSCYNGTQPDGCSERYMDLLVRSSRYTGSDTKEIDLQGLPWHLIAADLRNSFNMDISDDKMRYTWIDGECDFTGNVKTTNSAGQFGGISVVVFIFTAIFLCK